MRKLEEYVLNFDEEAFSRRNFHPILLNTPDSIGEVNVEDGEVLTCSHCKTTFENISDYASMIIRRKCPVCKYTVLTKESYFKSRIIFERILMSEDYPVSKPAFI